MRHVIYDYESLRRQWLDDLDRAGERRSLSGGELRMLERGSLVVLLASRLQSFDRRVWASRLALHASWVLLAVVVASSAMTAGPQGAGWLDGWPLLGLMLAGLGAVVALHAFLRRWLSRRRRFFLELGETTVGLDETVR